MLAHGLQLGGLTGDVLTDLLIGFAAPLAAVGLAATLRGVHPRAWTSGVQWLAVTLGILWILDYVLIASDYRDADGFIDCGLNCSALQGLVAVTFWYGGTLLVLTILVSLGALAFLSLRHVSTRPSGWTRGRTDDEKEGR